MVGVVGVLIVALVLMVMDLIRDHLMVMVKAMVMVKVKVQAVVQDLVVVYL